jgi:hypothetical protein
MITTNFFPFDTYKIDNDIFDRISRDTGIDVDEMWSEFNNMLIKVIDKHIPCKERRVNVKSEEWINDKILNERHNRDYLHERALRSKLETDRDLYKAAEIVSHSKSEK